MTRFSKGFWIKCVGLALCCPVHALKINPDPEDWVVAKAYVSAQPNP